MRRFVGLREMPSHETSSNKLGFTAATLAALLLAGCISTEQPSSDYLFLGRVLSEDPDTKEATLMLCTLSTYWGEDPRLAYIVVAADANGVATQPNSPYVTPHGSDSNKKPPYALMWRYILESPSSVSWGSKYVGFGSNVNTPPANAAAAESSVPSDCIARVPDPSGHYSKPGTFAFVFSSQDRLILKEAPHAEGFRYVY
ncbi:hypothetical protein JNM87_06515 [Candidatus Saccharibacteria bacterium]|nr:hypothetical protein [Candidatus Saccharibacteria bacterium]